MVIAMQIMVLIFGVIPVSQVCCNLEKFGPQHIKIKVTQLSYPVIPNSPKVNFLVALLLHLIVNE